MITLIKPREVDIFFFFFPDEFLQKENTSENDIHLTAESTGYVFISYSSQNADAANAIANILRQNGISSWVADTEIPVGTHFPEDILTAIESCSCFLLLLTNSAQESPWVSREVERAIHYNKEILPVLLEDVKLNKAFELYISISQFLPLNEISENSREMQSIIRKIKALMK